MLSKQASHALKALLELAGEPQRWRSTQQLASAQHLPEPMLEQVLLRLRRAGLLVARRGRLGGYRLALPAHELSVASVLAGLGEGMVVDAVNTRPPPDASPADKVTHALQQRLQRARQKALAELSLEDLLFDLRSAEASADSETGLLLG